MTKEIRRLGVALIVLFTLLFLNLNYRQVVQASKLADDPRNTRTAVRDFSRGRGTIETADGVVIAQSVPTSDSFGRQRQYPKGDLFGHITGFFSFTYGSDGLERQYSDELAGRNLGLRPSSLSDVLVDRSRTGRVTITIDSRLQQLARDLLGNRKGSVVVLDPTNGDVKAMWSFPSYDPSPLAGHDQEQVRNAWNLLSLDPAKPRLARAYRDRFFPGSTFKVVTTTAVEQRAPELVAKPYPQLRELTLPQTTRTLANFGREQCGGTLPDLLRISCNTGFAQIGLDLGADRLSSQAMDFGFASRPPLDLPAVAASTFPEAAAFKHDLPALAQSAIGQRDVAATPLQMALVAAGIANGGTIMKPHLMAEIRDSENAVVRTAKPEAWRVATTAEAAAAVRDLMIGVVASGTGTAAQIPGIQVAGKTGTAQTGRDTAHAWFIGFAPADAPRVAVAVLVEDQPTVREATGGRVAAPIAQQMMRAALGLG